jgi:hypothetical protein
MWVVHNHTPFATAGSFVCDKNGYMHWVVAVRATLEFADSGRLVRAAEQLPVSRTPVFRGPATTSSLIHDNDLVLPKTATDVIVDAHAWAPAQRPVTMLDVGFELGPIRKQLRVHGPRSWIHSATQDITPGTPQTFVTSPIGYECAFGGADKSGGHFAPNPAGRGYALSPTELLHTLAPSIEDLAEPLMAKRRPSRAAGFGAIAAHWSPRSAFAGTYDARWQRERAPLWPQDLDERFFQSAPVDQQVPGQLRGGEECVLVHLTKSGSARFRLPKIRIEVVTQFKDASERSEATLQTVLIQPEASRLTLVWSAAHVSQDREHRLEHSRVTWEGEKTWAEPQQRT